MNTDRPYIAWDEQSDRLVVSLPHQCGEWRIGGPQEVEQMIQALRGVRPEFKRPDAYRHPHVCPRCGVVCFMQSTNCQKFHCSARESDWVCSACFYPAQTERRAACQQTRHPGTDCEYPICLRCRRCTRGCQCKKATP